MIKLTIWIGFNKLYSILDEHEDGRSQPWPCYLSFSTSFSRVSRESSLSMHSENGHFMRNKILHARLPLDSSHYIKELKDFSEDIILSDIMVVF